MNSSSLPPKIKLEIAYDGTAYSGWQIQQNANSIQTMIEKNLAIILRTPTKLIGSGRTDSGVHALAQVAHFSFEGELNLNKVLHSLNGLLPNDIRILSLENAPPSFHARYSAKGKIYRYHLNQTPFLNPFKRLYSYHLPYPIDLSLLKKGSQIFTGKHDFTSFSNEAHKGSASRDAVRTLKRLDILEEDNEIILEFEGDGFLYKMVRNITGTLIDCARGKIPLEELSTILDAKDRRRAGTAAPARGLFLIKVNYD